MANYVYRLAQVGSWVMINARWYNCTAASRIAEWTLLLRRLTGGWAMLIGTGIYRIYRQLTT
jgi:hypothetical protein